MEHAVISCLQADSSSPATLHSEAHQTRLAAEILALIPSSSSTPSSTASSDPDEPVDPATPEIILPAGRLDRTAHRGHNGNARTWHGPDLRHTRVLMQTLCEIRLELYTPDDTLLAATLEHRHAMTMALWRDRQRALFTQPDVERGIEARLDAGFRHARSGCVREAAGEFKRAYLLLCCVMTHARDMARRRGASQYGQLNCPV